MEDHSKGIDMWFSYLLLSFVIASAVTYKIGKQGDPAETFTIWFFFWPVLSSWAFADWLATRKRIKRWW
ncbi:MAG: hypothetical protein ACWGQW_00190 [bacterium]